MAEQQSQPIVTEYPGDAAPDGGVNGLGASSVPLTPILGYSDDDRPAGGISVIPMPRREIARLTGTLRLSGLPRHKPTIVFGASQQSRDMDDE